MKSGPSASKLRAAGGIVAGAVLGLWLSGAAESVYVGVKASLPLQGLLGLAAFGTGLHGLFGIGAGLLLALLAMIWRPKRLRVFLELPGRRAGIACLLMTVLGVTVIGSFRLSRDAGFSLPVAGLLAGLGSLLVGAIAGHLVMRVASKLPLGAPSVVASLALWLLGRASLVQAPAEAVDPASAASAQHPNVILVVVDTLRADRTGPWGGHDAKGSLTPALDAFAAQSVRFSSFHSNASWTRPAVSSILTGQRPARHGVQRKVDRLPKTGPHVAAAFAAAGYATAASVTNVNLAPDFGFERGFEAYRYHAPSRPFGAGGPAVRLSAINVLRLVSERLGGGMQASSYYGAAPAVTKDALGLLDQLGDGPFFLWVHYMDPHDPYLKHPADGSGLARVRTPHPELSQASNADALYQGEIRYWDQSFKTLIDGLAARGRLKDTVIALTADHGEEFGEHGGFWHGETLFQELTHIPLLLRLPGAARGGEVINTPASQVDVLPTLTALAAVKTPDQLDGRSLLGSLEVPSLAPERPIVEDEDHDGAKLTGLIWRGLKLVRANQDNPRGLPEEAVYDLQADPSEQHPLTATDPRVATMRKTLAAVEAGQTIAAPRTTVKVDQGLEEDLRSLGYVQ